MKVLVLTLDVCSLDLPGLAELKEAIRAATGVGPDEIMVNTSHTHSGPAMVRGGCWRFRPGYFATVIQNCVRAATGALEDLTDAGLRVGSAPLDIGCNRRETASDGKVVIGVNEDGPGWRSLTSGISCARTPPTWCFLPRPSTERSWAARTF